VLVPRGIFHIVQTGSGVEQLFDYLRVIGARFVDGRPDRRTEDSTAVHASRLERSPASDEQTHRFQLPTVRGPVKSVQTGARSCRWIDALRQQVVRNAGPTEKTRAGQRFRERLRFIAKASLFKPFAYQRLVAGGTRSGVKQWLEPREIAAVESSKCVAEHDIFVAGACIHGGLSAYAFRCLSHLQTEPSSESMTSPTGRKPHLAKTRVEAFASENVWARTTRTSPLLKA